MDFFGILIVVVGLGTGAFIAVVLAYVIGAGLMSAWSRITHRHREHRAS